MTRYEILENEDGPYGFIIEGHSAYAEEGSDIVCAAVSSAAYMVINTITDILGIKAEISQSDAFLSIEVKSGDIKRCGYLFEGLELHLDFLAQEYPENITRGD